MSTHFVPSLALSLMLAAAAQAAPQTLYRFTGGADGAVPVPPMLGVNGVLYGVTSAGGANGSGTVYAFNPTALTLTTLYDLPAHTALPRYVSQGPLAYHDGALFGTAILGGAKGDGVIFEVEISSRSGSIAYQFKGGQDGAYPVSGIVQKNGKFFGTTQNGGANNSGCDGAGCGTIFRFDPTTDNEIQIYQFQNGPDGAFPWALTPAFGELFGVAASGGSATCQCGTVFLASLTGGSPVTVHTFTGGTDGSEPDGALLPVGNLLYGTTFSGGTGTCAPVGYGCGTIYVINPRTGEEKVLYSFKGHQNGGRPQQSLVFLHGKLYGVTLLGGSITCHDNEGCGVLFQYDLASHQERDVYKFHLPGTGYDAPGESIMVMGDTIYGTTGASNQGFYGTIFSYTP